MKLSSKRVAGTAAATTVFAAGIGTGVALDDDAARNRGPVNAGVTPKVMPNFNHQQARSEFRVHGATVKVSGLPNAAPVSVCVPQPTKLHSPTRHRLVTKTGHERKARGAVRRASERVHSNGLTGFGVGTRGAHVKTVQKYLRAAGFPTRDQSGVYGKSTRQAVCNFQASVSLNPTGRIDSGTWAKLAKAYVLGVGKHRHHNPAQRVGEISAGVRSSERLMSQLGLRPGVVDGKFTQNTQEASRKYERRHRGNGTDGAIGPGQYRNMKQTLQAKERAKARRLARVKPKVIHRPSPNQSSRMGTDIDHIILHHTASNNVAGDLATLRSPRAQVSAHYLVGRDGKIYQLVDDSRSAWHAGKSSPPFMNSRSIGIEITNDGVGTPFTNAQYKALERLVPYLANRYNVPSANIKSHRAVAIPRGRKNDPAPYFKWDRIRDAVRMAR